MNEVQGQSRVDAILDGWSARFDGIPTEQLFAQLRLQLASIRVLGSGRPVAAADLAASTGLAVEAVSGVFEQMGRMGAELDEDGNLVGNVLTLVPTPLRFRVGDRALYAWCALDTLFLPAYLGQTAVVESDCPVSGESIRLTVRPDGVESYDPAGTVVSIIDPAKTSCATVGPESEMCSQMRFFARREAAETWLEDHPGVVILEVAEAYRVARASIELMERAEAAAR